MGSNVTSGFSSVPPSGQGGSSTSAYYQMNSDERALFTASELKAFDTQKLTKEQIQPKIDERRRQRFGNGQAVINLGGNTPYNDGYQGVSNPLSLPNNTPSLPPEGSLFGNPGNNIYLQQNPNANPAQSQASNPWAKPASNASYTDASPPLANSDSVDSLSDGTSVDNASAMEDEESSSGLGAGEAAAVGAGATAAGIAAASGSSGSSGSEAIDKNNAKEKAGDAKNEASKAQGNVETEKNKATQAGDQAAAKAKPGEDVTKQAQASQKNFSQQMQQAQQVSPEIAQAGAAKANGMDKEIANAQQAQQEGNAAKTDAAKEIGIAIGMEVAFLAVTNSGLVLQGIATGLYAAAGAMAPLAAIPIIGQIIFVPIIAALNAAASAVLAARVALAAASVAIKATAAARFIAGGVKAAKSTALFARASAAVAKASAKVSAAMAAMSRAIAKMMQKLKSAMKMGGAAGAGAGAGAATAGAGAATAGAGAVTASAGAATAGAGAATAGGAGAAAGAGTAGAAAGGAAAGGGGISGALAQLSNMMKQAASSAKASMASATAPIRQSWQQASIKSQQVLAEKMAARGLGANATGAGAAGAAGGAAGAGAEAGAGSAAGAGGRAGAEAGEGAARSNPFDNVKPDPPPRPVAESPEILKARAAQDSLKKELGLPPEATQAQINSAFRKESLTVHPDKLAQAGVQPGSPQWVAAEARMKQLNGLKTDAGKLPPTPPPTATPKGDVAKNPNTSPTPESTPGSNPFKEPPPTYAEATARPPLALEYPGSSSAAIPRRPVPDTPPPSYAEATRQPLALEAPPGAANTIPRKPVPNTPPPSYAEATSKPLALEGVETAAEKSSSSIWSHVAFSGGMILAPMMFAGGGGEEEEEGAVDETGSVEGEQTNGQTPVNPNGLAQSPPPPYSPFQGYPQQQQRPGIGAFGGLPPVYTSPAAFAAQASGSPFPAAPFPAPGMGNPMTSPPPATAGSPNFFPIDEKRTATWSQVVGTPAIQGM